MNLLGFSPHNPKFKSFSRNQKIRGNSLQLRLTSVGLFCCGSRNVDWAVKAPEYLYPVTGSPADGPRATRRYAAHRHTPHRRFEGVHMGFYCLSRSA